MLLNGLRQAQKAQQVGRGAARASYSLSGLLVGQAKFVDQTGNPLGLLQRRQILALQVFNQGHGQGRLIVC